MLDERSKQVLCAVVQSYINTPDPVGSRVVTKRYSFGLSPATIRNIMADLEEMGFLKQPHTSAGRIPTDMGYRFYVDSIVAERNHSNKEFMREIYRRLEILRNDINMLLNETTRTLSLLSHYLGVAMSPKPNMTTLKRIELLKYRADQIVAILFTDEGLIKNKIISLGSEITQRDLNRIAGYLDSKFSGYTPAEIRSRVIKEMAKEKDMCDSLISKAMKICKETFCFPQGEVFVSGLSEVLELPDFSDLEKIRELSRAIEDKHTIVKLLDKISELDGIQIVIGSENSMDEMKKFSVVVSTCKEANRPIGVIGIIGPTRMDYSRAIYIVDNTAKFITKMLAER
ncbi:MAG: heat-inducible transcription repressor HrcA [Nitrospirae bacterium]|nr:heat-inducible transcription repressor HrcA [Nitrospirota bacterium]